jgi:hypothetical protein
MSMNRTLTATLALLLATPAAATVSFNYELPGKTNTTATFDYSGVETFDSRAVGAGQTFTTDFGTTGDPVVITGKYTNVQILPGDVYSNGTNYAVTFSNGGYLLELSTSDNSPLTYFGYYLPALDNGNKLEFLKGGSIVATITPGNVIANTGACPNVANPYCGNPGGPFAGGNKREPYAFINVYFSDGASFDAVRFFENPQVGGYESDNHTVGYFIEKGGVVPEPATWAMMIAGFGLVGFAARRRREGAAVVSA